MGSHCKTVLSCVSVCGTRIRSHSSFGMSPACLYRTPRCSNAGGYIPLTMIHEDDRSLSPTQYLRASLTQEHEIVSSSVQSSQQLLLWLRGPRIVSFHIESIAALHTNTCFPWISLIWSHPPTATMMCLRILWGTGRAEPTFLYHFLTDS